MSGLQTAAIGLNAPLGVAMVSKNEAGFLVWVPFAWTVDVPRVWIRRRAVPPCERQRRLFLRPSRA